MTPGIQIPTNLRFQPVIGTFWSRYHLVTFSSHESKCQLRWTNNWHRFCTRSYISLQPVPTCYSHLLHATSALREFSLIEVCILPTLYKLHMFCLRTTLRIYNNIPLKMIPEKITCFKILFGTFLMHHCSVAVVLHRCEYGFNCTYKYGPLFAYQCLTLYVKDMKPGLKFGTHPRLKPFWSHLYVVSTILILELRKV